MIGTIGTAPEREGLSALTLGRHGGNIDSPDICAGNTLFLPVFKEGALLHLGDVHAIQGDGEINAAPVEVPAECTLTVDVIKGKSITWPRIESPEYIITIGISKPLDDALKIATKEMVFWLKEEYGFDIWDASLLITSLAKVRVCGVGNPLISVTINFPKKYLIKNK
jgi:acetamidase/formamidase